MELSSSLDSGTEAEIAEKLSSVISKALSTASSGRKQADLNGDSEQGQTNQDIRVEVREYSNISWRETDKDLFSPCVRAREAMNFGQSLLLTVF
ncbi:hypothetical protein OESDEN_05759 [Oesophagostomum dentatum]|uniref:Uncharacterized protein n=1 Tax=Oesophagostomum dentatum TaxID=61180 RepID=A0A0B1TDX2_OESDE|nr:hypothetical protein OESDEN_05759 [Oesophagostomum dentatum]